MRVLEGLEALEVARSKNEGGAEAIRTISRYAGCVGLQAGIEQDAITGGLRSALSKRLHASGAGDEPACSSNSNDWWHAHTGGDRAQQVVHEIIVVLVKKGSLD